MDIRFQVLDAEKLLRVDAEGKVNVAATLRVAKEIAAFDAPHPVLVDVRRLQGRLSMLEIVELVKTLTMEVERYQRRLALLVRNDDQLERARFMETYSRNRGLPIAAFADYEEAVRWLHAP